MVDAAPRVTGAMTASAYWLSTGTAVDTIGGSLRSPIYAVAQNESAVTVQCD